MGRREERPLPPLSGTCDLPSMMSRRMTSDIIGCDGGLLIKLYSKEVPQETVEAEVFYTRVAEEHGIKVPEITGIVEDDGRWGYIYRHVRGMTLFHELMAHQDEVAEISLLLASLHWQIHGHHDARLPSVKLRLRSTIEASVKIPIDLAEEALASIERLPDGQSICHGDMHPENIIVSSDGPTVLDWVDAAVGHHLADVARTILILEVWLPSKVIEHGITITDEQHANLRKGYLESYLKLSNANEDKLNEWLLPVAVARLGQEVPGEESKLLKIIERLR